VIAATATGVSLVKEFFGREPRRWWKARRENHVVICGLGRTGQRLVEVLCHAGDKVLVIDEGANQAAVVDAMEAGASLLLGNVTDRPALRKAGIHRARYVYATMDDTGTNVGIALHAIAIVQESRPLVPLDRTCLFTLPIRHCAPCSAATAPSERMGGGRASACSGAPGHRGT
jgi:voltage-gated potassium channel Kch